MARLLSIPFELNTNTDMVETRITGSPSIQTSIVRSGTYAARFTSMSSGVQKMIFPKFIKNGGAGVNGPIYVRAYFYFVTFPSADNTIMALGDDGTTNVLLKVTSTGTLKLTSTGGVQIGSDSSALNTAQWYRIEMLQDASPASGSRIARARINGSEFAAATNLTTQVSAMNQVKVGANVISESQTQGDWYVDDVAVNDGTGSFQNTWVGDSKLLVMRPDSAGDASAWSSAGVSATGSAWSDLDETTPNTTDYQESNTLNQEFYVNFAASGLSASSTIQCVEFHARHSGAGASANSAFKLQAKKTSGGTVSQGTEVNPANTTWQTNDNQAGPPSLILHQDPDSSNWTSDTLDSIQAGAKITNADTNTARITTLWLVVDYIPGASDTYTKDNSVKNSIKTTYYSGCSYDWKPSTDNTGKNRGYQS